MFHWLELQEKPVQATETRRLLRGICHWAGSLSPLSAAVTSHPHLPLLPGPSTPAWSAGTAELWIASVLLSSIHFSLDNKCRTHIRVNSSYVYSFNFLIFLTVAVGGGRVAVVFSELQEETDLNKVYSPCLAKLLPCPWLKLL